MVLISNERPDTASITYRIISLLEQQLKDSGESPKRIREHEEYRSTGRTAALDKLARESGIQVDCFYQMLAGKKFIPPNERYRLCQALDVREDAIWY